MGYLTIISKSANNWNALTPELNCIGTAQSRELLLRQGREAIALALAGQSQPEAVLQSVSQLDPALRGELDGTEEIVFLEPAPMNPVSLEIAVALEGAGVSQSELARRLGTSRSAVSRLVNPFYWGHSMDLLRRIADALGLQIEVKLKAA